MMKRREMNDRRVERILYIGTLGLSTNQAISILLALVLIGDAHSGYGKG
jgi:TctA family transporter